MIRALIDHPWIAVVAIMLVLLALEELCPRDDRGDLGAERIFVNFMLEGLGIGLLGLVGIFIPFWSANPGDALVPDFGIAIWLQLSWTAGLFLLFVVDSLFSYWLHRASHYFKPLWHLHAVHHTDRAVDMTTGIRHHPLEALPSFAIQLVAIIVCGVTPGQAIVVSLANTFWALFTHAAIGRNELNFWPSMRFLVSPSFHRLHHSCDDRLANSNYSNTLAIWDWIFRTARNPLNESAGDIGLRRGYGGAETLRFQLLLPFSRNAF